MESRKMSEAKLPAYSSVNTWSADIHHFISQFNKSIHRIEKYLLNLPTVICHMHLI